MANLAAIVAEAFLDAPYPAEGISQPTYDDEGTTAHFSGTHWKDHSASTLRGFEPSLTFFTPEAFRFFLPAYLLAALEDPSSNIPDSVSGHLCPPRNDPTRPSYYAKWRLLSVPQRRAVVAFLRYQEGAGLLLTVGAIDALEKGIALPHT